MITGAVRFFQRGRLSHVYGLFILSLTSMTKESDHRHLPCEFHFKYTQIEQETTIIDVKRERKKGISYIKY